MGVISLSDVQSAPAEAVALYERYRPLIAQIRAGDSVEELRQELLVDCSVLKANCDVYCRDCIDEVVDYLLRCFEE
ncbi:MAG: hypothetical protein ACLTPC_01455 [Lacrimispora saccharolytica]